MKKALITAEIDPSTITQLELLGYEVVVAGWGQTRMAMTQEDLVAAVADIALLVVELEKVSKDIILAAPKLEIIHVCRSGPGNVDVEEATERGIPVLVAPGRNADSVADFTVGMILGIARNISRAERHLRAKGWYVEDEIPYFHFRGPELPGKNLGLIGCGAIGRRFLERMQGFAMRTMIFDPYLQPEDISACGELGDLETVLQEADFLVILCPLTEDTRDMIGADEISSMKATSFLINPARAAVVNEDALFVALKNKTIAGAALDVFWQEPLPDDSPWITLPNILITPHIAGASNQVRQHHGDMLIEDLRLLQAGKIPQRVANPSSIIDCVDSES